MTRSKYRFISGNIITVLIWRFLIIMVLLMLSRIGFYIFNYNMFPDMTFREFLGVMRGGIVFDLSAAVYFNMLFILLLSIPFDIRYNRIYEQVVKYLYFIVNGLMICMNGADYVYYKFLTKRATADVFGTFENEQRLGKMFFRFLFDYWPATLFTLFLLFCMVYLYGRVKPSRPQPKNRLFYFGVNLLIMPAVFILTIGAARGGYRNSTRPITISNAAKYVKNPRNVGIVLNTPFSVLRTYGKKELKKYDFFPEEKLRSLYNPHYVSEPKGPFRSFNVVIIIMESFAKEYTGFFNRDLDGGTYEGFTPFLDSLLAEGLTFDMSIENGIKSIDAMPSILASMPSLEAPYIISPYANNEINGLPSLLKKKGYYSAFFHGAANGSMGFDSFARMAGFDSYYGMNEYKGEEGFDGMWGIWDEPFLQFFADRLDEFKRPFMATVFTLSSHHPFKVPEKYQGKFKKGPIPICETIGYSDYSLSRFFKKVSTKPWFDSTLFVITADHSMTRFHPEYEATSGQFSIPILFYMHNSDLKGIKKRIAQQIDIMPSILSYLNYDGEYIAFGNNIFDDSKESFGFNTSLNNYYFYFFKNDYFIEMTDNKTVSLFNYKTDRLCTNNLAGKFPEQQSVMEDVMRAVIQTYNQRVIDNQLTVKK